MEQVRASHILVDTIEQANSLLESINSGADFADLARTNSKCGSGARGGDLGSFGKGMMVPPFENAAFSLEVGQISAPVQTQFGWHIISRTE